MSLGKATHIIGKRCHAEPGPELNSGSSISALVLSLGGDPGPGSG